MKIVRDNREIQLTNDEIYDAYTEYHHYCFKQDILSKAEEMGIEIPDELLNKVLYRADKTLDNNDSYWDSYWMSIEYAIEDVLKGKPVG